MTAETRFRRLYYALSLLDPAAYPNAALETASRTKAVFS